MSKFNVILEKLEKRYQKIEIRNRIYFLEKGEYVAYLEKSGKSQILVIYFECSNNIIRNDSGKVAVILSNTIIWTKKIEFLQIESITKKSDSFWIQSDVEIKKSKSLHNGETFSVIGQIRKNDGNIEFNSSIFQIKILDTNEKQISERMSAIISEEKISLEEWRTKHCGTIEYPYWIKEYPVEIMV